MKKVRIKLCAMILAVSFLSTVFGDNLEIFMKTDTAKVAIADANLDISVTGNAIKAVIDVIDAIKPFVESPVDDPVNKYAIEAAISTVGHGLELTLVFEAPTDDVLAKIAVAAATAAIAVTEKINDPVVTQHALHASRAILEDIVEVIQGVLNNVTFATAKDTIVAARATIDTATAVATEEGTIAIEEDIVTAIEEVIVIVEEAMATEEEATEVAAGDPKLSKKDQAIGTSYALAENAQRILAVSGLTYTPEGMVLAATLEGGMVFLENYDTAEIIAKEGFKITKKGFKDIKKELEKAKKGAEQELEKALKEAEKLGTDILDAAKDAKRELEKIFKF